MEPIDVIDLSNCTETDFDDYQSCKSGDTAN